MQVFYASDSEYSGTMPLETLIGDFNENDGWYARHNETDMRDELNSRGWYEGLHVGGRYLVLNLDKLQLQQNGLRL